MLEVLEAGPPATIQDAGRPGFGHLGVPADGAADPWSLAIANLLVGNGPGAAAVELAFAGPTLRALDDVLVALAGADLGTVVQPAGRPVAVGAAVRLRVGEELLVPGPAVAHGGIRAYLAVAGGFDVPPVLGSRSTCLAGAFGGLDGRPLRAGDRLPIGRAAEEPAIDDRWPHDPIAPRRRDPDGTVVVRILPGPAGDLAGPLATRSWTVAAASDRMGLRLEGAALSAPPEPVTSHGVVRGTVQLPPDGHPIVLLAAHQPTGGYPVAGVTIAADLPGLGQLAPGDAVRFEVVSSATARAALDAQRAAWEAAVAVLRADAPWRDLWHSAGG
jgi:biotin-dependent carboxylase-like uncharacterized protein